ncbi:peptidylprolyl isomerase [Sandarakinorhabdus sp. DWP1-3-1]|uniref:peptidylprolyl isomerase n=1 Tax=Sandarakinorhabdus sp. DWP1-3-1 TaxID=2804627 RepID=UPI003CF4D811
MMIRAALLTLSLATAALAQAPPPVPPTPPETPAPVATPFPAPPPGPVPAPVPAPLPQPTGPRVVLQTRGGPITIELNRDKAPVTTANFLKYVDQKRLDGSSFYRELKFPYPTPLGLVQFGVRGRSDKVLPPIAHESTAKTGLSHTDGAISMARGAPGSAQGDFFIIIGDLHTLDASDKDAGYAVFGRVVEGMDVVRKIIDAPTSPTAGEGAMKGQMIAAPVVVTTARRGK